MTAIDLDGFDAKFAADADPWATLQSRDEATKRDAIRVAIGEHRLGRILELASGNGSNSVMLATRGLRLDAVEGTAQGTRLTAAALAGAPHARAIQLALPARFPRAAYDAVVVAELLYYLSPVAMARLARDVGCALPIGGLVVLAHHRVDYYDFAQRAETIGQRFLAATRARWAVRDVRKTSRWQVTVARKRSNR